jgi:hypothetical protein
MLIASRRIPRARRKSARTCRGENAHEHSIRMTALNVSLPDKRGGPKAALSPAHSKRDARRRGVCGDFRRSKPGRRSYNAAVVSQ